MAVTMESVLKSNLNTWLSEIYCPLQISKEMGSLSLPFLPGGILWAKKHLFLAWGWGKFPLPA